MEAEDWKRALERSVAEALTEEDKNYSPRFFIAYLSGWLREEGEQALSDKLMSILRR